MTSLTIELPSDIYTVLRAEARRQGKPEQMLAQELLTAHLSTDSRPISLALAPEVQALLATMSDADLLVPPQGTPADAIQLLQSWTAEDSTSMAEEGEGTWEDVLRAIDANRTSDRPLFAHLDTKP